jgi:hypothetical protein
MAGSAAADPPSDRRSVASRRRTSMLARSLTASRTTAHRFSHSRSDSANGSGELSLGCSADPWRIVELGIAISERTVSRYLRGRPRVRSQTWRTFFANHFGGTFVPLSVRLADAHDEDIVVDTSNVSSCPALSIDASCARLHWLKVGHRRSFHPSPLDVRLRLHHLEDHSGTPRSVGRDPPPHAIAISLSVRPRRCFFIHAQAPSRPRACGINVSRTWPKAMSLKFGLKSTPERRTGPTLH